MLFYFYGISVWHVNFTFRNSYTEKCEMIMNVTLVTQQEYL